MVAFFYKTTIIIHMNDNFDELKRMMDNLPEEERAALYDKMRGEVAAASRSHYGSSSTKRVLIVDDLGVITFQLEMMFIKNNYEVTVSQEIYDAITKFKNGNFDLVIIDLFIPTEREGFLLLDELKKMAQMRNQDLKIGVITASAKKEHKIACHQKGVSFYMEKSNNWQKELLDVCSKL